MQIILNLQAKGEEIAVAIGFKTSELKFALAILKGIQGVVKADWIQTAIDDLEEYLKPKAIPFENHFHICEKCFMEIDDREENAVHLTGLVNKWKHRVCKDLKPNRPR